MSRRTILFSACALLASATSAKAITIVLTDTGVTPMTAAQLSAFNAAADIWEGIYFDPITININIEFASLDPNCLAPAAFDFRDGSIAVEALGPAFGAA